MATEDNEVLTDDNIESLRVVELRDECKKRNLSFTGKKSDLIDRLKSFFHDDQAGMFSLVARFGGADHENAFGALLHFQL